MTAAHRLSVSDVSKTSVARRAITSVYVPRGDADRSWIAVCSVCAVLSRADMADIYHLTNRGRTMPLYLPMM